MNDCTRPSSRFPCVPPLADAGHAPPAGPAALSSRAMVGEAVGEYRIVRELGRGRAGVVYLAENGSHSRPVALKVLTGGEGDEARSRVQRFLDAATAASALGHPGIAAALAHGFV